MTIVELSLRAQDFLNKLDDSTRERILKRLKNLETNPIPSDAKFIIRDKEDMIFRYRIGLFRALYKFKKMQDIVLITKIDKRDKIYD